MSSLRRLLPGDEDAPLHDTAASRAIERLALSGGPPHALIERAGAAVARLALALAPHAREVWVAAGPGNNGGDGLVAARCLKAAGKSVHVTWLGRPDRLPADAAHAHREAMLAGLTLHPPGVRPESRPEVAIDALLGLGQVRAPEWPLEAEVDQLNRWRAQGTRVLAVDLPTGLCADTGRALGQVVIGADATLSLLTAKPGLFTADGRDAAGAVWLDDLGVDTSATTASARLSGRRDARQALAPRLAARHVSHKGRFGDAWVVGGATGMAGAALLAAQAALHAGAGRVYYSLLDAGSESAAIANPELMQRTWAAGHATGLANDATVICGCGGGEAVRAVLPELISRARQLVLDADALNALAADSGLARQIVERARRGAATILTPHPLEAARLLGVTASEVQADRLSAGSALAGRFGAIVVLKGSGSVIAAPGQPPVINPTGNARLATPGTGDVLAGWLGGCWSTRAQAGPVDDGAMAAAIGTAWLHGRAAEAASTGMPLVAGALIGSMARLANRLA
ncbi:MAG: NAD(P)H-hydrate dehydratase [Pseudomonadota bacterium]